MLFKLLVVVNVFVLVSAGPTSGKCGESAFWGFEQSSGTLRINGTGSMWSFSSYQEVPWDELKPDINAVVFEGTITSIGAFSFMDCVHVPQIIIPSTVTEIGNMAFALCESLTRVDIPASVSNIASNNNVFGGCTKLLTIHVESGNTYFKDNDGVLFTADQKTLISFPGGKLGSYNVSDSVKSIANYAFDTCIGLTNVFIPKSVQTIGSGPFPSCSNLLRIDVDEENEKYASVDGVLFTKDKTLLIQYPGGKKSSIYVVPDEVTLIEMNSFEGCEGLVSVTVPASASIDDGSFSFCPNLEFISFLGTSLQNADKCFTACDNLRIICVPLGYSSNTVCERSDICRSESCNVSRYIGNHCFSAECGNNELVSIKRDNATEWEKNTNGCVEYTCNNNTGPVSRSLCSSADSAMCIDNKCFVGEVATDKQWIVRITIQDEEGVVALNTSKIIRDVCDLTGLKPESVKVAAKTDDLGHILEVVLILEDENSAQLAADAINDLEKGKQCPYGVLCLSKRALVQPNEWFSGSNLRCVNAVILYLILSMILFVLF